MAVLINKQTGLAEDVGPEALQSGQYDVPLFDAEGQSIAVPFEEARTLVSQGYRQPSPEELQSALTYAKRSSGVEQAKTFAEGAASAATLGLSTGLQVGLGISDPQDIRERRDVNPGVHAAGQAAGIVGSALTGVGSAPLMTAAATRLVPQLGANALGRVGTAAARGAIENMVFQSGDEASKIFMGDPEQTASSIIQSVGLAGLVGGAATGGFGGASELWKMGPGRGVTAALQRLNSRAAGLPDDLKNTAGIDIPVEIEAALSGQPKATELFQQIAQTNTKAGDAARAAQAKLKESVDNAVYEAVGRDADTVLTSMNRSEAEIGKSLKDTLIREFKEIADPVTSQFQKFSDRFKKAGIGEYEQTDLISKINQFAVDSGALKAPSSAENKMINQVLKEIPLQETAEDLRVYASRLQSENPFGSPGYQTAKQLRKLLNNAQDNLIEIQIQKDAPELLADFANLKKDYGAVKDVIADLNDRLRAGKQGGVESFLNNVREMSPEDLARRLGPQGDVEMQQLLQSMFPNLAKEVRDSEMDKLISKSFFKGEFDANRLFKQLEKLSPEMKSFLMSEDNISRLGAVREILNRIPKDANPSGSARMVDAIMGPQATGAIGIATAIMSGGTTAVLASIGHMAGREGVPAAKLALLKYMARGDKISAPGFRALEKSADAVIKAAQTFESGAAHVVGLGGKIVPLVAQADIDKLDKEVERMQTNPQQMLALGGDLGDYDPEASSALGMQAGQAMQYLSTLKPKTTPIGPLDPPRQPNKTEMARYRSALVIAQSPLTVFNKVKDGTLTQNDLTDLKNMYPALYMSMQSKLMEKVIDAKSKDLTIPYSVKKNLGVFTGSALDSSFMPVNFNMNQQSMVPKPANQQSPGVVKNPGKLDKIPASMASPSARRQINQQ